MHDMELALGGRELVLVLGGMVRSVLLLHT